MDKPYTHRQIENVMNYHKEEILDKLPELPVNSMGWEINGGKLGLDMSAGYYNIEELRALSKVLSEFFDD